MESGQKTHLPKINTPEPKKVLTNSNVNITTFPAISKSISDNKSDSVSSSAISSASLVSKTSLVKVAQKASGSSSRSGSSDSNTSDKPKKKGSKIKKYYYLQPTYIHPERMDLPERAVKKKNLEVPSQMALKVNKKEKFQ